MKRWKNWARRMKRETWALYLAARDPRTPWAARLLALAVVIYAFSPLDLIPDFIPVLGYLDDLLLVPLGLWLALRLVPPEVMAEARQTAEQMEHAPVSHGQRLLGAGLILAIWAAGVVCVGVWVWSRWKAGL